MASPLIRAVPLITCACSGEASSIIELPDTLLAASTLVVGHFSGEFLAPEDLWSGAPSDMPVKLELQEGDFVEILGYSEASNDLGIQAGRFELDEKGQTLDSPKHSFRWSESSGLVPVEPNDVLLTGYRFSIDKPTRCATIRIVGVEETELYAYGLRGRALGLEDGQFLLLGSRGLVRLDGEGLSTSVPYDGPDIADGFLAGGRVFVVTSSGAVSELDLVTARTRPAVPAPVEGEVTSFASGTEGPTGLEVVVAFMSGRVSHFVDGQWLTWDLFPGATEPGLGGAVLRPRSALVAWPSSKDVFELSGDEPVPYPSALTHGITMLTTSPDQRVFASDDLGQVSVLREQAFERIPGDSLGYWGMSITETEDGVLLGTSVGHARETLDDGTVCETQRLSAFGFDNLLRVSKGRWFTAGSNSLRRIAYGWLEAE